LETSSFLIPVRVFFDSHNTVTKYEHLDTQKLYNLTLNEIEETITKFIFKEIDKQLSSFTFSYYFLPISIKFDSEGTSCSIMNVELEQIYGKNFTQLHRIFEK
jgi:hypothetical protein